MQRKHLLIFECLEDRLLPSIVVPVSPAAEDQRDQTTELHSTTGADQAPAMTPPAMTPPAMTPPAGGDAVSTVANQAAASAAPHDDAEEDLAEMRLWLQNRAAWVAMGDDDWLEDLHEFYEILGRDLTSLPPLDTESGLHGNQLPTVSAHAAQELAQAPIEFVPETPPVALPAPSPVFAVVSPTVAIRAQATGDRPLEDEVLIPVRAQAANGSPIAESFDNAATALMDDAEAVPVTQVESLLRRFLDAFQRAIDNAVIIGGDKGLLPWLASALLATTMLEAARRRLHVRDSRVQLPCGFGLIFDRTSEAP